MLELALDVLVAVAVGVLLEPILYPDPLKKLPDFVDAELDLLVLDVVLELLVVVVCAI